MDYPLVSIITPCYNGEQYLDRYFSSILAQTYPNLELIFINDGSSDRTEEIALSYRDTLEQRGIAYQYLYQENAGQAAALNRGLKLFRGEYLTWPDSDDEMTADCIEKKVSYLLQNPDVEMVRSNGVYHDEQTGQRRRIADQPPQDKADILEQLLLVTTYGCCGCYMISRRLFLNCYPDRNIPESRVGQNWQLLVPAASHSRCGYIDRDLYIVYEHPDSHSRVRRSIEKNYKRQDDFAEVLLDALTHCRDEHRTLERLVWGNCARQKFYYAVSVQDRPMLRATMKQMLRCRMASLHDCLLFCKYILPINMIRGEK